MATPPPRRYVYLLRIWEEEAGRPPTRSRRYSLQELRGHRRRGFRDLGHLVAYLATLTGTGAPPDREPPPG